MNPFLSKFELGVRNISLADIDALKLRAAAAPLRRDRICLHKSTDDSVQEMIIAFTAESYVRPHRHIGKTESFHMMEGECLVVFFDDTGQVTKTLHLGPYGSPFHCVYRLSDELWHSVIFLTDTVVLHEILTGPFDKNLTEFPDWAPDSDDLEGVARWRQALKHTLNSKSL